MWFISVATPLWAKCEDETHTPKSENLESSGTPATSELNSKGQNTLPWNVLYIVGKVLKCRCPKWPRMSHLDIFSPSYGQKKGRESNWQFDFRPLKVGNRPLPDVCRRSAMGHQKVSRRATTLVQTSLQSEVGARKYECPKSREFNPGQFRDSSLGVPEKSAILMWLPQSNAENTIWGKVVASPESGPWWVKWVQSRPWFVPTPNGCRMSSNQLGVSFGCKIV